ncbi:integrase catalytic domain-containing protein [Trichonephila clavipes]|nr:integrase catalytic domain-containing protein [Trichonephila clavipes]
MAEAQSFELLKTKRKSFRTAITKVVNELETELSNSDLNVDRLCELVEILCIKFEPLTVIDQQMELLFKPEEFDVKFEIPEKYRGKVLLCRLIDYEQVLVDWEKEGIIEKIVQDEPKIGGKFHYLPHRPVFKENSTTKICPVFDGSAHHRKSCSLKDCVEKRPNLIGMIRAILNRFRLGKIGVISDIRKAFLQISLHKNDIIFYLSFGGKVVIRRTLVSTGIVEWFLKFLAVSFYYRQY